MQGGTAVASPSRWHEAEERLFVAIQYAKQQAREGAAAELVIEREVLPAMRKAAEVHVNSGRKHLPPGADLEDVISHVDERIVRMLRTMDLGLDVPQIVTWIYRSIRMAVADAGREHDELTRRDRMKANEIQALKEQRERELGRPLTEVEQREVARSALTVKVAASAKAPRLSALLVSGVQKHALDESMDLPGEASTEEEAEQSWQAQALHIAGANIDSDRIHAAFAETINGKQLTNEGLEASVRVAMTEQLAHFGMLDAVTPIEEALDLARTNRSGANGRKRRFFRFVVPNWGPLHDRIIDAIAVNPLGLQIGIDRSADPIEVVIAEPPELLWDARRWRLIAIALADPRITDQGRREWIAYTGRIRERLPGRLEMRVITKEMYLAEIRRLRSLATTRDTEQPVAGDFEAESEKPNIALPPEIDRGRSRVAVIPLKALHRVPVAKWDEITAADALVVRRDPKHPRYVISMTRRSAPLFALPSELTRHLDFDCGAGALWVASHWRIKKDAGSVSVLLRRSVARHGTPRRYESDHCRCPACSAANTEKQAAWRKRNGRVAAPKLPTDFKHGAQCRKRGCDCEIGKEAERERQRRSRERRHAAVAKK